MAINAAALRTYGQNPGINAAEIEANVANIINQRTRNEALRSTLDAQNRDNQAMQLAAAGRLDEARNVAPMATLAYEQQNAATNAATRGNQQAEFDTILSIAQNARMAEDKSKGGARQALGFGKNMDILRRNGLIPADGDLSAYTDEEMLAEIDQIIDYAKTRGTPMAPAKQTSLMQNIAAYNDAVSRGDMATANLLRDGITKPATSVTVNNKAEGKGQEEIAKNKARQLQAIEDQADAAYNDLSLISQFESALQNIRTGRGEEAIQSLKGLLETVGGEGTLESLDLDDNLAESDLIQTLNMELAARYMSATKGAISDREFAAFRSAAPGLANTPEGNALLIDAIRRAANRDIAIDELAQDYVQEYGSLYSGPGWRKQLNQWKADNPPFTDDELAEIDSVSSPKSAQGANAWLSDERFIGAPDDIKRKISDRAGFATPEEMERMLEAAGAL